MSTISLIGSFIEITSVCDGHCPYCYNSSGANGMHLDVSRIYSVIDELSSDTNLTLSGGEPLLHPNFSEILEYAYNKGLKKIRVITNGKHIYQLNRIDLLAKCELQLTLESIDRKIHEQYRGEGTYRVFETLKKELLKYSDRGRIVVRINISHRNCNDIEKMVELCREYRVDTIRLAFLQCKGRAELDKALISAESEEGVDIISRLQQIQLQYEKSGINIDFSECLPNKGCELMDLYNIAISPMITVEGTVYPCTKLTYAFSSLGNINNSSLKQIINSDKAKKLFSNIQNRWKVYGECKECFWKNMCFKGCPATAFEKYMTIDHISGSCEYLKQIHLQRIWNQSR